MVGAQQQSAAAANAGTQVAATVSCPAGKVVLGGGGETTSDDTGTPGATLLQASYPSSATEWTVIGVVRARLANGRRMFVRAYALCSP